MKYFWLFLCVSCTVGPTISIPDASIGDSYINQNNHPCQINQLPIDFYNCGLCNNICSSDDADRCFDGQCRCGPNGICDETTDCRLGRCISPDLNGINCEFDDECVAGYYCIMAHCTFVECVPEECDGIDNDCDGIIDGTRMGPLGEWCYSGGPDPLTVQEPCQAGFRTCLSGTWSECLNEVVPHSEQGLNGCDGIDNDCDGCIDAILEKGMCQTRVPSHFDIVFIIDTSGSMTDKIENVRIAASTFSSIFSGFSNYSFAIVLLYDLAINTDGPYVYSDLSDFATFQSRLTLMPTNQGGLEYQYDAIAQLATGALPLSWTEDSARIFIVFTDEEAQSITRMAETEMCNSMTHGESLFVFNMPFYFPQFDDCAETFSVANDTTQIVNDLRTIISDPCDR